MINQPHVHQSARGQAHTGMRFTDTLRLYEAKGLDPAAARPEARASTAKRFGEGAIISRLADQLH